MIFFFNGGAEQVFPGEDRCLILPKVATYDSSRDERPRSPRGRQAH